MNDALISVIEKATIAARQDLERETHEQLEGIYGWLPNGEFDPPARHPALASLEEARATRLMLEQLVRDEREAGIVPSAARKRLLEETAFTWLNRFVAFKMFETRGILKRVVAAPDNLNSLVQWLVKDENAEARRLYEAGDVPVDALGEGPRQRAYRRFLQSQCGELGKEIPVLFDPATLASRLFPRPLALRALVSALGAEDISEAWKPGNEEAIGWIYQAFNAERKAEVFASFGKGEKVTADGIAPATQTFTPRWVVRYLVENSLGRLWLEMHPNSGLRARLSYLVPPATDPEPRAMKPVQEILFLDPCCGSMHFGVLAFDLFVEMYREELLKAGERGWPAVPSVRSEAEIPAAILAHNIHGIDLDVRAVQLSAMALFLKARTLNKSAVVTDRNLACCNVEAITGGRLEVLIRGADLDKPVFGRILEAMATRLRDSSHLGSLLRPERDLERLIVEERRKLERDHGFLPGLGESDLPELDTPEKREAFFGNLADEISGKLDEFVGQSRKRGRDESHFANEASKGLRFLRLVQIRYDVVATNPPYIDSRDYNEIHKRYLEQEYPAGKRNLFAAFIQRAVDLTDPTGFCGMITGQSFLFLSSFEDLRSTLLDSASVVTLSQYGYHLFSERVDTAAFVLQKQVSAEGRDSAEAIYFRLARERDSGAKRLLFESALESIGKCGKHPRVYRFSQRHFDAIPGKPWVYWASVGIRALFSTMQQLGEAATPRMGMGTRNNTRFLRYWWEPGLQGVARDAQSVQEELAGNRRWFPYMKGGAMCRWYGNQEYIVNYWKGGTELKTEQLDKYPYLNGNTGWIVPSEEYYFQRGITWTDLTSGRFSARLSPGGFIFDVKGSSAFPENVPFIMGILNSVVANYILNLLNPTVSFQVGDLARLPIPRSSSSGLEKLVEQAISLARADSAESEITYDFISPPAWPAGCDLLSKRRAEQEGVEREVNNEVFRLYGISSDDRRLIEAELNDGPSPEAASDAADSNDVAEDDDSGSPPISRQELARRWISYAAGIVLGRFEIGTPEGIGRGQFTADVAARVKGFVELDGVLADDPGQPRDISARVFDALEAMLDSAEAAALVKEGCGDGESIEALRAWLGSGFWKEHFRLYRKRPIYWPLQSPKKRYTVWIFHEKLDRDSLFRIRTEIVEPRLRLAEREIADLRGKATIDRGATKVLDRLRDLADDLRAFSERLKTVSGTGYTPRIDDGVLLNAAPLHSLLPSWPETKKAWDELAAGKYDWAHQAMDHWPDRVKEKCETNRSYAIAHGQPVPEMGSDSPATARKKRTRKAS